MLNPTGKPSGNAYAPTAIWIAGLLLWAAGLSAATRSNRDAWGILVAGVGALTMIAATLWHQHIASGGEPLPARFVRVVTTYAGCGLFAISILVLTADAWPPIILVPFLIIGAVMVLWTFPPFAWILGRL